MQRAAVAMAVLLISSFAVAAPAGAAASITVDPHDDLTNGQTVTVSGSSFHPNAGIISAECRASLISVSACDVSTVKFTTSDDSGAYSFATAVHPQLQTPDGFVDCSVSDGACVIGVAEQTDIAGTAVTAPISFAPPEPPRAGSLFVSATRVAANTDVQVIASDFAPNVTIDNAICAADATTADDCEAPSSTISDATGAFTFYAYPQKTLVTVNDRSIDCTVDAACVYAAWDARDFTVSLTTVAVRLAPEVAGTLTVTPSTGLLDLDQVTLTGAGWPSELLMQAWECDGPTTDAACDNNAFIATRSDGTLSTKYTVRSAPGGGDVVDCELRPCWIVVTWYTAGGLIEASQPISFDVTPKPVTSHYTNGELAAVSGAATALGLSNAEEQHVGAWALSWVLAITNTVTITPVPNSGSNDLTTDWLPSQYHLMGAVAASHGTTLAEYQKTGALFLAYVLALT